MSTRSHAPPLASAGDTGPMRGASSSEDLFLLVCLNVMQQTRKPRCRLEIKKEFDVSSKMARVSALTQINLPPWFRENGWVDRVAIDKRCCVEVGGKKGDLYKFFGRADNNRMRQFSIAEAWAL